MAEQNSTTITPKKGQEQEPERVPGPETVYEAQDRLRRIIALAYLGKRAFMEGDLSNEGWHQYFSEINCPDGEYDLDSLVEMAFDELLRMTSGVWQMLNDPADAVEGKHIDRTQAAPGGGE